MRLYNRLVTTVQATAITQSINCIKIMYPGLTSPNANRQTTKYITIFAKKVAKNCDSTTSIRRSCPILSAPYSSKKSTLKLRKAQSKPSYLCGRNGKSTSYPSTRGTRNTQILSPSMPHLLRKRRTRLSSCTGRNFYSWQPSTSQTVCHAQV